MPNIPLLLANLGFAIILISLTFRDILWLRVFAVLGTVLVFPLYIFRDEIVWTSLSWNFAGVLINLLQIVILILYRRPLVLKGIEKQIYTYGGNSEIVHRIPYVREIHGYHRANSTKRVSSHASI